MSYSNIAARVRKCQQLLLFCVTGFVTIVTLMMLCILQSLFMPEADCVALLVPYNTFHYACDQDD
jgi:hypothetical protein